MIKETNPPIDAAIVDRIAKEAGREIPKIAQAQSKVFVAIEARKLLQPWVLTYFGCGVLLLGFGFAGGWFMQRTNVDALRGTMSGLQHMAYQDGAAEQWWALMAYNHMHDVTGKDCRVTVVNGRRRCDTSIWLDPEPAETGKPQ